MKPAGVLIVVAAEYRFPLGKTGVLIEAQYDSSRKPGTKCGFRWVKPAASLKLV